MEGRNHKITLAAPPREVLKALPEAAQGWSATWTQEGAGGRLELPVRHGLRYGSLLAEVQVEPSEEGTVVTLEEQEENLEVHTSAVAVLLFAALAAIATVFWPLFPALTALLPLSLVLGVAAWLLVVSRLQSSGPQDFLLWLGECAEKRPARS